MIYCLSGRGWKSTYNTDDKLEVERKCTEHGGTFEWLANNTLKVVSPILPAVKLNPETNQMTWFNSIVAVFYGWRDSRNSPDTAITYGDGSPLDCCDVLTCSRIMDELSVSFEWQRGDVLLIDNRAVLHSRKSFLPPRRILAALFQ